VRSAVDEELAGKPSQRDADKGQFEVELDRDGVCHDHLLGLPASDRSV